MQFSTTGTHALTQGIKILVYGRTGVGKTRLIPTAPKPIILSAEAGTLSIVQENIPMIIIRNLADFEEAYNWLLSSVDARPFETVCLDSFSEIAEQVLRGEKAKNKDGRAAYGEMGEKMAEWARKFRDLPGKNVYFAAKEELRTVEGTPAMFTAMMPGKQTSQGLPYYLDGFFRMERRTHVDANAKIIPYTCLVTQQDVNLEAKDRSGALDPIEQPHLGNIFAKIRARFALQPPSPQ